MRLRSGKVLPGSTKQVVYEPNVQEPTYKLSAVVLETIRHYNAVRQREIAELEKAVNKAIHVLNSYMVAFYETDHYVGCDHVMEKIRLVAMMFAYANSLTIPTMMHHRLGKVRTMMLKMCVKFSKEAKEQIIRAKEKGGTGTGAILLFGMLAWYTYDGLAEKRWDLQYLFEV